MIVDEFGVRPGVADIVQMPADWRVWHAVTGLHACVPGSTCGEGFVLLVEQGHVAPLRIEMESRFGSYPSNVMVSETTFLGIATEYVRAIASPSAHPEPAFDASAFGVEQALTGLIDAGQAVPELEGEGDFAWITAARQEATDVTALWWLEDDLGLQLMVGSSGVSAAPPLPYLVTAMWSEDRSTVAIGGLPAETSVVAVSLDDGTSVWQRPIGGLVVLDVRRSLSDRIHILDSTGEEILGVEESRQDEWNIVLPDV